MAVGGEYLAAVCEDFLEEESECCILLTGCILAHPPHWLLLLENSAENISPEYAHEPEEAVAAIACLAHTGVFVRHGRDQARHVR